MTTMTAGIDVENIETRVMAALYESRKARHHRDCICRMFDRQFCNAADALWQRALNRELEHIATIRKRNQP